MILVLYGLFKLVLGILALTLTLEYREKLQSIIIIKDFITLDLTAAGRFIDFTIIIFALYSIIRGLVIAKTLKAKSLKYIITNPRYIYILYGVLGLVLLLFYSMIVYTNWNDILGISKKDERINTYKLSGIGSGIVFLITMIAIYFLNTHKKLKIKEVLFLIVVMTILVMTLIEIIAATLLVDAEKKNEIITMVMIPLGGA